MGIISLEHMNELYWLGRYTERKGERWASDSDAGCD